MRPIFPLGKPNILEAKETPKNGTALAGSGWWDASQKTIVVRRDISSHASG